MQNEAQTILDRVLNGLGYKKPSKMEFATMKTADGQNTFESEGFQPTDAVFIVSEDGNIKVPAGTYEMEDGTKISVDESGVITEILSPEQKEEMQNDPMKEATGKPVAQEQSQSPKTIIETMTKETQFAEATPSVEDTKEAQTMSKPALLVKCEEMVGGGELAEKVAEAIVSIVESQEGEAIIEEYKKAKSGTMMSAQTKDTNDNMIMEALKKLEIQLSEIKGENDKLKDELSKEGNRTYFNPEQKSNQKINFRIGAKREETVQDRVFNQLF